MAISFLRLTLAALIPETLFPMPPCPAIINDCDHGMGFRIGILNWHVDLNSIRRGSIRCPRLMASMSPGAGCVLLNVIGQ